MSIIIIIIIFKILKPSSVIIIIIIIKVHNKLTTVLHKFCQHSTPISFWKDSEAKCSQKNCSVCSSEIIITSQHEQTALFLPVNNGSSFSNQ